MKLNPGIAEIGNDAKILQKFGARQHSFCTEAGEDDTGADTYCVPGSVLIPADLRDRRSCPQQCRGLLQTGENTTLSKSCFKKHFRKLAGGLD